MKTETRKTMSLGNFRNLIADDEKAVSFRIMNESGQDNGKIYEFICPKEMNERGDVAAAIERTLHEMLNNEFDDESIEFYLGAVKKENLEEKSESYIDIDLGYVLPGMPYGYNFSRELFRKNMYERFKMFWMSSRNYTIQDAVQSIMEFAEESYGDYSKQPVEQLVKDWETECGFGGEIYPCYSEFITSEYLDSDFMPSLCWNNNEKNTYLSDPYLAYPNYEREEE